MKKLFVFTLAVMMVVAFTVPASALTNKFGGYWETKFASYSNLGVSDVATAGTDDLAQVGTRTRLYYTAILHDNLKLVNKFEIDTVWGDGTTGDIGADGKGVFEIKNTYAEFKLANLNWSVGVQGFKWGNGFIFNNDATGIKATYKSDAITTGFYWVRPSEGGADNNGQDFDIFATQVFFKAGNATIAPQITYATANSGGVGTQSAPAGNVLGESVNLYFVGVDAWFKFDMFDLSFSGHYLGGDIADNFEAASYIFDTKLKVKLAKFGIHSEILYASGDDDATDTENNAWMTIGNAGSVGSSELWGEGTLDVAVPQTSFKTDPTNYLAFNLGATYKVNKAWKLKFDYWNLNYVEDAGVGSDTSIGNELSVKATWAMLKSLNMDIIAAYLVAGDAIEPATDSENPYEIGVKLSLKF